MLYIVKEETNAILWRDDAWDSECFNKARDFMTCKELIFVKKEITFNGDMVIWVK